MSAFRFLNQDQTGVMAAPCRPGVETPAGSFAREVAEIGTLGAVDQLSAVELAEIGVVIATLSPFDGLTETVVADDWQRNPDGSVEIVSQTVTQALTTAPIDPLVIAERDAALAANALTNAQTTARHAIDAAAGAARARFITVIAGQEATYTVKEAEARAWATEIAGGNPTPDPLGYPYLKARAERLDPVTPDYQAVATEWLAKADAWHVINTEIEGAREGANEAAQTAIDAAAVQAIQTDAIAAFAAIVAAHVVI